MHASKAQIIPKRLDRRVRSEYLPQEPAKLLLECSRATINVALFSAIGLGLFLLGSLALFVSLIMVHLRNREDITLAALLMVAAVALTALTDNPIVFAYVIVPVAVVISAALATDRLRHLSLSAPTE